MSVKNQGFVMIPREVKQFPIWQKPHELTLWMYCCLTASHKGYRQLKPGQFFTSARIVASELGWSRNTVRGTWAALVGKKLLDVKTTPYGTIVTVCYWDEITGGYEEGLPEYVLQNAAAREISHRGSKSDPLGSALAYGNTEFDPTMDEELHNPWSFDGREEVHDLTPDKKDNNNVCNRKKDTDTQEAKRASEFLTLWDQYPRKLNKEAAEKRFCSMTAPLDDLLIALNEARYSPEWIKEDGRFIPAPDKWLDGQWERYAPKKQIAAEDEPWTTW